MTDPLMNTTGSAKQGLPPPDSLWRRLWRSLRRSRTGQAGLVITLLVLLMAIFADQVSPHDPLAQNLANRLKGPFWMTGSFDHPLGTDSLGRDLLSRIMHGARVSLLVGLASVLFSGALGVTLGLLSGYYRGAIDSFIMRLADIQLAMPTLVLALAMVAVLSPSLMNIVIIVGVTGWVQYARVVRGEVLAVRNREFVDAARALGAADLRILAAHILPVILSSIIVVSTLRIGTAVLLEATLSFLGLGVQPPTPTWGGMVSEGRALVYRAWWVSAFPGIAILLAVLGVNLLGDWIRDALDPRIKG